MRLSVKICLVVLPAVVLGAAWATYDLWAREKTRAEIKARPDREDDSSPSEAYALGWYYVQVKQPEKGLPLLIKAANQGVSGAMCQLGWMYKSGTGTPKDPEASLRWYKLAEANGNPWGTLGIANAYDKGIGLPVDHAKAFALLMKLVKEKSEGLVGMAACELGWHFENGIGRPVDRAEAIKWYRIAASKHKGSFGADKRAQARLKELEVGPWR